MADACFEACVDLLRKHNSMSRVVAVQHLRNMRSEGRWQTDVWGIVSHFDESKQQIARNKRMAAKIWLSKFSRQEDDTEVTADESVSSGPEAADDIAKIWLKKFQTKKEGPVKDESTEHDKATSSLGPKSDRSSVSSTASFGPEIKLDGRSSFSSTEASSNRSSSFHESMSRIFPLPDTSEEVEIDGEQLEVASEEVELESGQVEL